ncbi:MAG: response regulator transcription factor [Candidatus Limnocylindrales bacterium]
MAENADRPILVVDDDAKIVRLVRTYLEREGHRVVEASDGPGALAAVASQDPALVVLDLMLPEIDGLAIIREVRRSADTPIIVLSARGTTADRIAGLLEGADDYLPKPFSPAELVLRVDRILSRTGRAGSPGGGPGTLPEPRSALILAGLVLDRDRHEARVDGAPVPLTALEFRLLAALLEANGRVLNRDQLLDAVYGRDADAVLDRTIDVHVGRLRDKLGDPAERPRFVVTIRGVGYRAAGSPTTATTPAGTNGRDEAG